MLNRMIAKRAEPTTATRAAVMPMLDLGSIGYSFLKAPMSRWYSSHAKNNDKSPKAISVNPNSLGPKSDVLEVALDVRPSRTSMEKNL